MICRHDCGACCIAPSISSPIPGMPNGKPAGVRCLQLDEDNRCLIFSDPARPLVCGQLRPSQEMCGTSAAVALAWLTQLEADTRPTSGCCPTADPGTAALKAVRSAVSGIK